MRFITSVLLLALFAFLGVSANIHDAERRKIIEAVNSNPNATWTAGLNQRFAGKPWAAVKRQLGALNLNVPSSQKLPLKIHTGFDVADIPASFDSRKQWPNCKSIQEIRDQSDCGSCWAFGAVEAGSDRICIETGNNVHLSAEDLLSCCSSCGFGCNGGDPGSAWSYFTQTGVVTGGNYGDYSLCSAYSLPNCEHHTTKTRYPSCSSFPGEFNTPSCPTACDANSTYTVPYAQDKHIFATSYSVGSDATQIQQEIMTNGPVEAAFTVYADFESYTGGVYQYTTGAELGGHAVKILGWGVDAQSNLPYWLVANSWNNDWGENGFFRIERGVDMCGIEDNIVAGLYTQAKHLEQTKKAQKQQKKHNKKHNKRK